jgi:signal transduction histidine kinase
MKFSLRAALASLWALILALCLALSFLMFSLFEQGAGAQLRQGRERLDRAAGDAARRYERYRQTFENQAPPLDDPQTRSDLASILSVAFSVHPGVEGGFWRGSNDSLAYAFPTHDGPRQKKDLPQAELGQIEQVIHGALEARTPQNRRYNGENASVLLHAAPLPGPPPDLTVWTMTRAPLSIGQSYGRLTFGLGALLLLALGSGLWLLFSLRRWTRRVSALEEAIRSTPLEELPPLSPTGEGELDRIVAAFNRLNSRLKTSREDSARLGRDLARSDRLAALGRMAAGLAHEIGNPLAAMRLRSENALAAEPERAQTALRAILPQIARLEELLAALRLLTRAVEIRPQPVALRPFLQARLDEVAPTANHTQTTLHLDPAPESDACWNFDEKSLARAVENLLLNALQHSAPGGRIALSAEVSADRCRLLVRDTGPGVAAADTERIFEPFVTTRADGVGLGLSLVREIAGAHGGSARCLPPSVALPGATFVIEIPSYGQNLDR